ncbi:TPA: hypothetical protein U2R15_004177 [Klebsiella aerogenes]|nr:hypothetical protein [Klebsiella aerogenes]
MKNKRDTVPGGSGLWALLTGQNGLQRLLRLQNAVMYYGGGWDRLSGRLTTRAEEVRADDPVTAQLLCEMAAYLQDVAYAGELGPSSWHPWREGAPTESVALPPDPLPGDRHG